MEFPELGDVRADELREALGLESPAPQDEEELPPPEPKGAKIKRYASKAFAICRMPPVIGAITFLVLFIIFLLTKPGFLGTDVINEKGETSRRANTKMCLLVSGVIGALVAGLPYLIRMWSQRKAEPAETS